MIPEQRQSVEWFNDIAVRLENFFALCLGTSLSLKRLQLFCGDKVGWLVQNVRCRNEKFNHQMIVRTSSAVMCAAVDKWLSVPEEKRPVEKTLLGMVRKTSAFVETEFLSLAQALEGFNRIQGGGKKDFAKRIEETYDLLSTDFALRLIGKRDKFVRKVVDTRNVFTHLGLKAGNAALQGGWEIFELNQQLHALLRCVMLLQLGVDESTLRGPILYQATRWRKY